MVLQICFVVILTIFQDVALQASRPLPKVYHQNHFEISPSPTEDNFPLSWATPSIGPPIRYPTKQLENTEKVIHSPAEPPQTFGEGSRRRRRRDVPNTSYSRSGSDGVMAYNPAGEAQPPANQSRVDDEETTTDDGSFTTAFQSDNGISSTMLDHKKPLPSGEQEQTEQGQYSHSPLGGSTVNTSWTVDGNGFHVQGPLITFGLGFGRR